ncbi:phage holin family protein [Phytopseudomonas flavescens]|uniref:phage holin family protein n=1 Tax=Phytopseudomonas flavescens TaxID=29435 RepID=UPI0009FEE8A3|nr:phage holin family protein [Pseudomonas flavescens]
MASLIMTQVTFWLCMALFMRLFTFQRGTLRFRRGMSCLAWVTMASAGAAVIHIARGDLTLPRPAWPLVALLAVFTWLVWRARGNLAGVLRSEGPCWNGVDRRRADVASDK